MKKIFGLFILIAVTLTLLLTSCGGGGEETYNNIAAQSNPYSMGTQSIEITASTVNSDAPTAKFKKSISASDIELGQALEGKKVTKVTYNSETSITVTLEGDTKVAGGKSVYGTITVKQSGMESKGNSTCTVNVRAPEVKVTSLSSHHKTVGDVTTYSIIAKLSLPAGEFTDKATAENIVLTGDATGEMTVELSGGSLMITIRKCNTANPTLTIKSAATTFEKEITVKLTVGGSVAIQ